MTKWKSGKDNNDEKLEKNKWQTINAFVYTPQQPQKHLNDCHKFVLRTGQKAKEVTGG